MPRMIQAITNEIELRKSEITEPIETVYFGGGTPSIVSKEGMSLIFGKISNSFELSDEVEITLEANPEDITVEAVQNWIRLGVNRLSVGIQTFDPNLLKLINRNHSAEQAFRAVDVARKNGILNLNGDFIFGLPHKDENYFEQDLRSLIELDFDHLSVYGLTIEEKTVFGKWVKTGKIEAPSDDVQMSQYQRIEDMLLKVGYEHYEVSNYAKEGRRSRHNTNYWLQKSYLGIGPGAHSYDHSSKIRRINVPNNHHYMKSLESGATLFEEESLDNTDLVNEYLLTRLRTDYGVDLSYLDSEFGIDLIEEKSSEISHLQSKGYLEKDNTILRLTKEGYALADEITLQLFYDK